MHFSTNVDKNQWFITPCIGVINESRYYGYPVFAIGFAWLVFRCKLEIGVRKWRHRHDT